MESGRSLMVLPDALKKRVVIARTSVLKVRSWCGGAAIDVQRPKLSCQAWLQRNDLRVGGEYRLFYMVDRDFKMR